MSFKFVKDFANIDFKKFGQQLLGVYKSGKTTDFPVTSDQNDIYINGNGPNKNFSENLGYGFWVRDVQTGKSAKGWGKYLLQINPQQFKQTEEFSIQFFPTPSGITTEQQGSILKRIMIAGVTGIHPKRGAGGVDKNGELVFASGNSGYKEFNDLRNYIRAYQQEKKDPKNINLQLIFLNYKDSEYLVVECNDFILSRSSSRPLMYEYTIDLTATGRLAQVERDSNTLDDILGKIDDVTDTVVNTLRVSRGIINGSVDLLRRADRGIRDTLLTPLQEIEGAVSDLNGGKTFVLELPRRFISDTKRTCRRIGDQVADLVGVDTSDYNAIQGRLAVNTPTNGREITYKERQLLKALNDSEKSLNLLMYTNEFYKSTTTEKSDFIQEYYGNQDIAIKGNATKYVQILDKDTVHTIAARELNDSGRYKELIILNNLKHPYIAETASSGVLSYDDKILVPIAIQDVDIVRNVFRNVEYAITRNLPESEKMLGVDIAINQDNDIRVNNLNDFDLVAGMENMLQFVKILTGVEKGDYGLHIRFGLSVSIGRKNTLNLATIKEDLQQQLQEDARIDGKNTKVYIRIEGSKVFLDIYLVVKGFNRALPLQLVSG